MEEAIAIIIAIIVILISNWRICKWKKEAATAYFIIGQKATTSEELEWLTAKPSNTVTLKQNYSTSMQLPTHSADANH